VMQVDFACVLDWHRFFGNKAYLSQSILLYCLYHRPAFSSLTR
jgi:hypothetical protein